jgi:hypothetical protein
LFDGVGALGVAGSERHTMGWDRGTVMDGSDIIARMHNM